MTVGRAYAAVTRTDYEGIYPDDRGVFDKILGKISKGKLGKKAAREIARATYGFSTTGSLYYPVANNDNWVWFEA